MKTVASFATFVSQVSSCLEADRKRIFASGIIEFLTVVGERPGDFMRGIVEEQVEDVFLFNGLLYGLGMERTKNFVLIPPTKEFHGLGLGGSRECEVREVPIAEARLSCLKLVTSAFCGRQRFLIFSAPSISDAAPRVNAPSYALVKTGRRIRGVERGMKAEKMREWAGIEGVGLCK